MQKPPFLFRVLGYYRITTDRKYKTRLQNLFFVWGITAYFDGEDGFFIRARDRAVLLDAAKKERLSISVSPLLGLPHRAFENRFRVGVPIGILLAILLLFCGTRTVWRVEISGNESLSSDEIEEGLSALGFGVGSKANQDCYDGIITAYRLAHSEIAWMGIYTKGTTAYVRVIENKAQNSQDSSGESGVHLVAAEDALVTRLELRHGTAAVKVGSVVKKGDVLVLGLVPGAHYDTILAAEGAVIGRISEEFAVEIPYRQIEKVEKQRKKLETQLFFFKKTINIFKKTSKIPMDYVIIERKEEFSIGKFVFPFGFAVREAIYYEECENILSKNEAVFEGVALLEQKIRAAVGDGELLARSVRVEEKEGACVVHATIEYTKNIAERLPFSVG